MHVFLMVDTTGAPRICVNSKGKRRRPGAKTLAQVLKSDDDLFVDFIAKCLIWDPERRLKPVPALRHPWITRRSSPQPGSGANGRAMHSPAPSVGGRIMSTASSFANPSAKNSKVLETPKKVRDRPHCDVNPLARRLT